MEIIEKLILAKLGGPRLYIKVNFGSSSNAIFSYGDTIRRELKNGYCETGWTHHDIENLILNGENLNAVKPGSLVQLYYEDPFITNIFADK